MIQDVLASAGVGHGRLAHACNASCIQLLPLRLPAIVFGVQLLSSTPSCMNKISGCALVCIPRAVLLWELVFQDRYAVAWARAVMLRRCFATDPRYNHESSNLLHAGVHRKHAVQTFYYRQDPVVPTSYPTTTAIGGPGRGPAAQGSVARQRGRKCSLRHRVSLVLGRRGSSEPGCGRRENVGHGAPTVARQHRVAPDDRRRLDLVITVTHYGVEPSTQMELFSTASRRKHATYPELAAWGARTLRVPGCEVRGRWSPPAVRAPAKDVWARRWWSVLSAAA